ncbi:uncharacterized protein LOC122278373 [Carya illinoinensis]|uniref:uncharacterized protein LOC122278373 n=1 Tax=Carya illinoinensis TaxID=32201 RepID=UPI001C724DDB|nr:uncharacterized protein LOC122278373 [Carya illinoinensis]
MLTLAFKVMNNEAEYETLIAGLSVSAQIGATEVDARSDSQVVVNQVLGVYAAKGEKLKKYLAQYVLPEIYEGICGNHSGGRTLARKAVWAGYCWPNALRDEWEFAKRCAKCQTYAPILHAPLEELASVTASWPFAQWG